MVKNIQEMHQAHKYPHFFIQGTHQVRRCVSKKYPTKKMLTDPFMNLPKGRKFQNFKSENMNLSSNMSKGDLNQES